MKESGNKIAASVPLERESSRKRMGLRVGKALILDEIKPLSNGKSFNWKFLFVSFYPLELILCDVVNTLIVVCQLYANIINTCTSCISITYAYA